MSVRVGFIATNGFDLFRRSCAAAFVGLAIDETVFDASTFSKNRDRLLAQEIAQGFLSSLLGLPEVKRLLSAERFSVDGTRLKAWASMKSFRPKDGSGEPPRPGRNGEADFRKTKRSNLPDETRASCLRFLFNALRFFRSLGVRVHRVMTDNGSSFRSRPTPKPCACSKLSICAPDPTPREPTAKLSASFKTRLCEWAYARAYRTSDERAAELPLWLHQYNWHRPHGSLRSNPPISRIAITEDNLLRLHS